MPRPAKRRKRLLDSTPQANPMARIEAARKLSAARRIGPPRIIGESGGSAVEALESRTMMSTSWFVSPIGNDANVGSLNAPFRSIQRAAVVAQPGDTVFVRGGTYHETVRPWHSGTASAPIVFKPYNNETVTIDGADPVTGWDGSGAPVFTTQMRWDLGPGMNQVFVDGQMMNEARWPNTSFDLSHPTFAAADAVSARAGSNIATIYDASLTQPAGFWYGATIHLAAGQGWVAETGTVVSSKPGQITFTYINNGSYETPKAGNHYYLTGVAGNLDSPGEFSRTSYGQLSLWTPAGDSPNNHVVEAKARQYAFDLAGVSNVEVDAFNLFAATINTDSRSANVVINGINAQYVSHFTWMPNGWAWQNQTGIMLKGPNDVLENSTIAYSAGDGVYVSGAGSTVTNNIIHDVDYSGGDSAGVQITGANVTVDHNTVYNTGRDGILIQKGRASVLYNVVHDFGLQTTDLGGIYTVNIDGQGSEIGYNTVYNGSSGGYGSSGVYLDNNSRYFLVDHNVTWNVTSGMKLNLTSRNEWVYNNTLDGTQSSIDKTWGGYDWSGTIFRNNIFTRGTQFGVGAVVQNNWTGNPGFVNPAAGDYRLLGNSAAINQGANLGQYTAGYAGAAPDIGALEYGATPFGVGAKIGSTTVVNPPPPPVPVSQPPVVVPPPTPKPPVVQKTPPPPTPPSTDARAGIDPFKLKAQSGPARASFGGLGYLYPGNFIEYSSINFSTGVKSVTFQIALSASCANQKIELRLDGPNGKVIGILTTKSTGGWDRYALETAAVSGATGIHDLYLKFIGHPGFGIGNIKSIKFA